MSSFLKILTGTINRLILQPVLKSVLLDIWGLSSHLVSLLKKKHFIVTIFTSICFWHITLPFLHQSFQHIILMTMGFDVAKSYQRQIEQNYSPLLYFVKICVLFWQKYRRLRQRINWWVWYNRFLWSGIHSVHFLLNRTYSIHCAFTAWFYYFLFCGIIIFHACFIFTYFMQQNMHIIKAQWNLSM